MRHFLVLALTLIISTYLVQCDEDTTSNPQNQLKIQKFEINQYKRIELEECKMAFVVEPQILSESFKYQFQPLLNSSITFFYKMVTLDQVKVEYLPNEQNNDFMKQNFNHLINSSTYTSWNDNIAFLFKVINPSCQEKKKQVFAFYPYFSIQYQTLQDTSNIGEHQLEIQPQKYVTLEIVCDTNCQYSNYLTISVNEKQNPSQKFNLYLSSINDAPTQTNFHYSAFYTNHLQIKMKKTYCDMNQYFSTSNVSIQVPNQLKNKKTIVVEAFAFSYQIQHSYIYSNGLEQNFYQSTGTQQYIFFNWSQQHSFKIIWNVQKFAVMLLKHCESEQEATNMFDLKEDENTKKWVNPGGQQQLSINKGEQFYCPNCYYVISIHHDNPTFLPPIHYSLKVVYQNELEHLELNQPVQRNIGKDFTVFDFTISLPAQTYYMQISAMNNLNSAQICVALQDCRQQYYKSSKINCTKKGTSQQAVVFQKNEVTIGETYCVGVKSQNGDIKTTIELIALNLGYTIITSGHPANLHFNISKNQNKRYFLIPIGNISAYVEKNQKILAQIFLQENNQHIEMESMKKLQYCIPIKAGFVNLNDQNLKESKFADIDLYLQSQFTDWCSFRMDWNGFKVKADSTDLQKLGVADVGILLDLKLTPHYDTNQSDSHPENYDQLSFQMTASIDSIVRLSVNSQLGDELSVKDNPEDTFSIEVTPGNTASINLYCCYGKVVLQLFNSLAQLQQNKPSDILDQITDGKIADTLTVEAEEQKSKIFYLRVLPDQKSLTQKQDEKSRYRITVDFSGEKKRQFKFEPEENKAIHFEQKSKDQITLTWGKILKVDNLSRAKSQVNEQYVKYNLYVTEDGNQSLEASCSLINFIEEKHQNLKNNTFVLKRPRDFNRDQNSIRLYVNVIAVVESIRQIIPYHKIEVVFSSKIDNNDKVKQYATIIVIILLVLLLVSFMFIAMAWKYRNMQKKLEYEMTDVRNVAGIELSSMGRDPMKHRPLKEDEVFTQ